MSGALRVLITPAAQADLDGIAAYVSARSSDGASRLCDELLQVIASLAEYPLRFPIAEEAAAWAREVRSVTVQSYRVLYSVRARDVVILRVVHGHMQRPASPSN